MEVVVYTTSIIVVTKSVIRRTIKAMIIVMQQKITKTLNKNISTG